MPTEPHNHTEPPVLLTTPQAAEILGFEPKTMEELRRKGGGPPYIRLSSRAVRYDLDQLRQWLLERTATSTAQEAAREREGEVTPARGRGK